MEQKELKRLLEEVASRQTDIGFSRDQVTGKFYTIRHK